MGGRLSDVIQSKKDETIISYQSETTLQIGKLCRNTDILKSQIPRLHVK